MSKPHNILGKFDSYAYHHILMVCNSTEAAEALAATDEITSFQHPRAAVERYTARTVGKTGTGKYVTLIDGTTDARFYITSARWNNVIAADSEIGKGDIPQSTTMSLDGELDIIEPLGASFLNVLTKICNELDTDPVGLVFVLKTIFVGHNTRGVTEMISTVRPMMFVAYDVTAVFDSSGAKYKLAFVGLTNGFGKLPQPNKIFQGMPFQVGGTLKETFSNLETLVNKNYEKFKSQIAKDFAKTFENESLPEANKFLIENYRDVTYKIITTDYDHDHFKAGNIELPQTKDKETGKMVVNYGLIGVEDLLNRIMSGCSAVQDEKNDPENKFIYKILSTLKTTADTFVVEYHINRYKQSVSPYTQQEKDGKIVPLDGQSIEFDYIFTGKNVDIKTFDIKMEMGMAFFQIAATTNSMTTQKENVLGSKSDVVATTGTTTTAGDGLKLRGRTPLFLGSTLTKPMSRNTTTPVDTASFQALLDRHASLENIAATMVIYGNPQLLDEMSILPSEVASKQTEDPKKDETINPRWMSSPTLIKVNIRMPVDANDVNTEYEAFWYSGYYNLMTVENIFEDGEFTQELGMFSIPVSNQAEAVVDEPADTTTVVAGSAAAVTTNTTTNVTTNTTSNTTTNTDKGTTKPNQKRQPANIETIETKRNYRLATRPSSTPTTKIKTG